jgi:pyrophosphatase PpaX
MAIRGIIFDLDGTLANTLPVCIKAYQDTVYHFCGRVPEEAEIIGLFGPNEEGMLEQMIPGQLTETLAYYLKVYEQYHLQLCTGLFPGIGGSLSAIQSKGIKMAIVSGKGAFSAAISMRILGLEQWIDLVETGFDYGPDKPRSLRIVLEKWGLRSPENTAYVGDAPYDMQAAREAGLLPLGAAWAQSSSLKPETPTYATFFDIASWREWIEKLAS